MICPYCDSRVQQVPDNRCCPNCGGPLGACAADETEKTHGFPEPPLGVYKQTFGFMEIQEQGIRFFSSFLGNVVDRYIPYEELYAVRFVPCGKKLGYLSVREKRDRDLPFVSDSMQASADETSVVLIRSENEQFQAIYDFFSVVCKLNK